MADTGGSRERTSISWGRTALSTAALGVLLLKLGITHGAPLETASGGLALVTTAGLMYLSRSAYRAGAVHAAPNALRAVTSAIVVVGVLAIVGAVI